MAAAKKTTPAPEPVGVNFGDLGMYSAGGGIPEGDYVLSELNVQMYQAQTQAGVARGPARLGVMVHLLPLGDPKAENEKTQFYSMGSNADKSFAPNPETGKSLVAIPGAAGTSFNNSTNWAYFLKSLYDSGLPQGIFTNDVSVLEGTHVHMSNVPEPEDRKSFRAQAATGEAAGEQQQQRPGTIAIVTEIKDDGKPWEGSGGIPAEAPAAAAPKAAPKAAAPKAAPKAAAPVEEPAAEVDEDLATAATNCISDVLEKNANGITKLKLRLGTFAAAKARKDLGEEVGNQITNSYFEPGTEAALDAVLGTLGYKLNGAQVSPA